MSYGLVLPSGKTNRAQNLRKMKNLIESETMEKKAYIKPYTVVNLIDGKEDLMFVINDKSFEAGGAPGKERDEIDEEEAAAAIQEAQKYSLW